MAGLNALGMGFVFTAKDLASGTFKYIRNEYINLHKTAKDGAMAWRSQMGVMAAGLGTMGVGLAAAAAGIKMATIAGEFEQQLVAASQTTEATAEQFNQLRDAAIDAGLATQFSPLEAAIGLRDLGAAGYEAADAMSMLNPILKLSTVSMGEIGIPEATAALGAAIRSFGMQAGDSQQIVDQLTQAANKSSLSFRDMRLAIANSAAAAQGADQSWETLLTTLAVVRNTGLDASSTSTAVRNLFGRVNMPTVQKALTGLGIETVDQTTGKYRDYIDILDELDQKTMSMGRKERGEIFYRAFGKYGEKAVNALKMFRTKTEDGMELVGFEAARALRKKLSPEEAKGATDEYMSKVLDTFKGQSDLLRGVFQTLGIGIGDIFAKTLKPVVHFLVISLAALAEKIAKMPDWMKKFFGTIFLGVAGVLALAGAFITLVFSLKLIAIGFGTLSGFFLAFAKVLGVIGLLLAPVLIASAVIYRAYKENLGGFADYITQVFDKIKLGIRAALDFIKQGYISSELANEIFGKGYTDALWFAQQVHAIYHRVRAFLDGVWQGFSDGLKRNAPVFEAFVQSLRNLAVTLGLIADKKANAFNATPSADFNQKGNEIGNNAADKFSLTARIMTVVTDFWHELVKGFLIGWSYFEGPMQYLKGRWDSLVASFGIAFAEFGRIFGTADGIDWKEIVKSLGMFIGLLASGLAAVLGVVIEAVRLVINIIFDLVHAIAGAIAGIKDIIVGVWEIFRGIADGDPSLIINGILKMVWGTVRALAEVYVVIIARILGSLAKSVAGLFGFDIPNVATWGWDKITGFMDSFLDPNNSGKSIMSSVDAGNENSDWDAMMSRPAVSEVAAQATNGQNMSQEQLASAVAEGVKKANQEQVIEVHTTLQTDGEVLANQVNRVNRNRANEGYGVA